MTNEEHVLRISAPPTFSPDQYRAVHEQAGVLRRELRGRILLRGADRKDYLHGLLSNDILALGQGDWCYSTLLTAQGRMISDMRVFELGDLILIDLEREVASTVAEHLEKFVITEDVTVENATDTLVQLGVYGPRAQEIVDAATTESSVAPDFVVPSSDTGISGLDLIVSVDRAEALASALQRAGAMPVDADTAELTRIEAGIPRFLVDMDTTTIPLEAGIEDRAISLTKGCYVGQEVIVRVLHRGGGRVAKKLVGLVLEREGRPGDLIFAGEREVGRITSAADSPRVQRWIALGYVHRDFVEPGTALSVRTAAADSPAVVVTLPFSPA
jgi:tRNA-modifying protein YgfZ